VVRFYNAKENHMYAMVFTVPAYRVTPVDHTVITFEERAQNAPEAIHEWFPPWENWGTEFVYPKPTLAAAVVPPAPQPPAAVVAPTAAPAPAPKPVETPAPTAQVEPTPPVEIAQAQPAPAPAATAPAPAAPQELPKTASNVPAVALFGGLLLLAGVVLRRRIS